MAIASCIHIAISRNSRLPNSMVWQMNSKSAEAKYPIATVNSIASTTKPIDVFQVIDCGATLLDIHMFYINPYRCFLS